MTKRSTKTKAVAASTEATEAWDKAQPTGSQNPEPKHGQEPTPDPAPAPTDKVDTEAAEATLKAAAAGLPVDPKSGETAEHVRSIVDKLPANPKKALVAAFKEIAFVVGVDKGKRVLAEHFGTEDPEDLKASQLMDAIDYLYGAQ